MQRAREFGLLLKPLIPAFNSQEMSLAPTAALHELTSTLSDDVLFELPSPPVLLVQDDITLVLGEVAARLFRALSPL